MSYTKSRFGAELVLLLDEGKNTGDIAKWADSVYYEHLREIDDDLSVIIQNIASMSFGSEFFYTEKELKDLAIQLIQAT
jgi:hypothetical protein